MKTICRWPKCWKEIEIKDTPWISYIAFCEECWWTDDRDYYLNPKTKQKELMTSEQAQEVGAMFKCKWCWDDITPWEKELYKWVCIFCQMG